MKISALSLLFICKNIWYFTFLFTITRMKKNSFVTPTVTPTVTPLLFYTFIEFVKMQ